LEAIEFLKREDGKTRVTDLSKHLNVKKPSVSGALEILQEKKLVVHERYGGIELTKKGKKIAKDIQAKHDILSKFLIDVLKVQPRIALEDACKIEHTISSVTFDKLRKFIKFIDICQNEDQTRWLKNLEMFYKTGKYKKCNRKKSDYV